MPFSAKLEAQHASFHSNMKTWATNHAWNKMERFGVPQSWIMIWNLLKGSGENVTSRKEKQIVIQTGPLLQIPIQNLKQTLKQRVFMLWI